MGGTTINSDLVPRVALVDKSDRKRFCAVAVALWNKVVRASGATGAPHIDSLLCHHRRRQMFSHISSLILPPPLSFLKTKSAKSAAR